MTLYSVKTGSVATSASQTKSLWMLNPAGDFFVLAQFAVSTAATASSATIGIELYRVTTIGSAAGTAFTPIKVNRVGDSSAAGTTAIAPVTTEPTAVEILAEWELQPFGGLLDIQYPLQREPLGQAGQQRVGLRYTTPAAVNPNLRSYVWFDER